MQTPTEIPDLLSKDSILKPLFNLLLFGKVETELIDQDLFEIPRYQYSEGFQNMVFSNGDFNPDDQLYIYKCLWEFEKKINTINKVSLLLNYIESEDAAKMLHEDIEQKNLDSTGDENGELAKLKTFTRLNQEILSNDDLPEELKIWLINKCEKVAINSYDGTSISEEKYEDLFSIFDKSTH